MSPQPRWDPISFSRGDAPDRVFYLQQVPEIQPTALRSFPSPGDEPGWGHGCAGSDPYGLPLARVILM